MKPYLFLWASCLIISISSYAQQKEDSCTIKGIIYDDAHRKPVGDASITLSNAHPQKSNIVIANQDGRFVFHVPLSDNYILTVTALGYAPKALTLSGSSVRSGQLSVDTIFIHAISKQLKDVVVTANKPLVTQEVDRIIYDVQADPENKIQNMLDMLRKVPLISVTAEDQLLLKGNSSYRVLLNGRTSSMMVRNPRDVLRMMPAAMVEKIEIITRPPAKYDGEGLAGIINVITTKKMGSGYIGNVNANYGRFNSGLGAQLSTRISKFSISAMLSSFWERTPLTSFNSSITSLTSEKFRQEQTGNNRYNGNVKIANISTSYEIDSLNLIAISGGLNNNNSKRPTSQFSNLFNSSEQLDQAFHLNKNATMENNGKDFQINYQLGFKRNKSQLLTASYSYMESSNNSQTLNIISERQHYNNTDLLQKNAESIKERTYQLDYVHPFKIVDIEGGFKLISRNNYSNFSSSTPDSLTGEFIRDKSASNDFDYGQDIYGLYNSYLFKIKNWGISGGVRVEQTFIHANFTTTGTVLKEHYTNFIPSLSVMRKFKNLTSIDAGYYRRIQRPAIMQLNPFVDKSDPTFYFSGNPDLLPVLNHNFSIGYSNYNKGYLNAGINYSFATNTIQRVIELGSDSISRSSYQNIGKDKNLSINISLNKAITKRLNFNINGVTSYIWVKGVINTNTYENSGIQGNAYCYLSYRFDNGWRTSVNAGFNSPTIILQGHSNAYFYSSASVTKAILKNKVTLAASVTNPFQRYRNSRNDITTPDFAQRFTYYNYARNFNLSVSYNFGKLEMSSLKRSKNKIKNDDINNNAKDNERGKP